MKVYDSVTPSDIPADAEAVAGYVDGEYAWPDSDRQRFPHFVGIAVRPSTNDGQVIDCESQDATPAQAAQWVRMRREAGLARPLVYCSRSNMEAVMAALAEAGTEAEIWSADWTGEPHDVPGAIAVQYANPLTSGGHYDLSIFDDGYFGATATPAAGNNMPTIRQGATGEIVVYLEELLASHGFAPDNSQRSNGDWDGIFGPQCRIKVTQFQASVGLADDGIVGPLTWEHLAEHPV